MPDEKDKKTEKKEEKGLSSEKLKKIIFGVVLLQVLIIGITMYFLFQGKPSVPTQGDDGGNSFVPFLPVWIAIFVPLFVKPRKDQTEEEKKKMLTWVVIGAFLLLLGAMVFMILSFK